ncbi:hypothetical protein LNKW23_21680 [Paralimibaculum aggregatum]|uniref:DUF1440 domain-containing protein n=1 Tax=Paralimibaculum aggregatum TaxID=3036245 RepID=A0ABQ6LL19_9RHOB|nr:hypothetical protein [Limibaculum sp. NKW23]GMG82955.1 hypothetical protein LNKW23_21680 [Limibaculum sp. NKW23]
MTLAPAVPAAPAAPAEAPSRSPAPAAILHAIATVLFAGAAATVAFDLFGQVLSPMLKSLASPYLGAKLAPVPLASQVLATLTGLPGKELGALGLPHGLHMLTGLVAYPLGYLLVVRPLHRAVLPGLHWAVPAAAYGVALWVLALYVMAHLVAGNPAFLGWGGLTWVALWGHVIFALVAAAVIEARLPR